MTASVDLIDELTARMLDAARDNGGTLDERQAQNVAAAVRREFAKDRVYIGATSAETLRQLGARNLEIVRDYRRGERVPLLTGRYNLSRSQILRILAEHRKTK